MIRYTTSAVLSALSVLVFANVASSAMIDSSLESCSSDNLDCQLRAADHQSMDPGDDLFGKPREFSPIENNSGKLHPRVLFNNEEFENMVSLYAERATVAGSFARYMMGRTKLYNTRKIKHLSSKKLSDGELRLLDRRYSGELEAQGFFVVAFKAFVYRKQASLHHPDCTIEGKYEANETPFYCCSENDRKRGYCMNDIGEAEEFMEKAKTMLSNWVRYLKIRRLTFRVWEFGVVPSREMGGAGFTLAYDILYNEFTPKERTEFNSWFGSVVLDLHDKYWAFQKPKTNIFSNWAGYNSDIYLINCVLEGTSDHAKERDILNREYQKILEAFAENSIYESGFTFEDGYTVSIGFREGSTGLVALARRGYNIFKTKRFRNFISYAAQSYEPWECSGFVGHSSGSGGGFIYQTFLAVQRFAYPEGALPNHLWRKTMGKNYNCYFKMQTGLGLLLFGGDHIANAPINPRDVIGASGSKMALHAYGRERGLLIARSSLNPDALYVHFNGRHDGMFPGHDNADRGTFTLSSHNRTWVPELPWRKHQEATKHCMLFVDGKAQNTKKAPSAKMVHDPFVDSGVLFSTLDLTYATTYKWNKPWSSPTRNSESGPEWEEENTDPRTLGFPRETAEKMGLPSSLHGFPLWGFRGFFQYRGLYNPVKYNIRSTAFVRDHQGATYFVVGDRVEKNDTNAHDYSWEMTLASDVSETVAQDESTGALILSTTSAAAGTPERKLAVYAFITIGDETSVPSEESFRISSMKGTAAKRLYIVPKSKAAGQVRFTVVLYPFLEGTDSMLQVSGDDRGDIAVTVKEEVRQFSVPDDGDGGFSVTEPAAQVVEQPVVSPEWVALSSPVEYSLPPRYIRFLSAGSRKTVPVTPEAYTAVSSRVFDRRFEVEYLNAFENYYEHLLIVLAPETGMFGFELCDGLPTSTVPKFSIYRFSDPSISGQSFYAAYQQRKMERKIIHTETCQVEASLQKDRIYILAAASPHNKIQLSYRLFSQ